MAALRILVTGSTGFLGRHLVDAVGHAGHVALTTARSGGDAAVDLTQDGMVDAVVEALRPDVVVHAAAMSRMADCQRDPQAAARANTWLPEQWALRFAGRALFTSTDLVFDGAAAPYPEDAATGPRSVYGASKVQGEQAVLRRGGRVVRLPLLFGPDAHGRGATASLRDALEHGRGCRLFTNEYRTPLHAVDAARALVDLVVEPDGPNLLHLPGPERVSRWQFAQRLCAVHGLSAERFEPVECHDPERPRDVSLVGGFRAERSLDEMLLDS